MVSRTLTLKKTRVSFRRLPLPSPLFFHGGGFGVRKVALFSGGVPRSGDKCDTIGDAIGTGIQLPGTVASQNRGEY